jgi:hypothetical protein
MYNFWYIEEPLLVAQVALSTFIFNRLTVQVVRWTFADSLLSCFSNRILHALDAGWTDREEYVPGGGVATGMKGSGFRVQGLVAPANLNRLQTSDPIRRQLGNDQGENGLGGALHACALYAILNHYHAAMFGMVTVSMTLDDVNDDPSASGLPQLAERRRSMHAIWSS